MLSTRTKYGLRIFLLVLACGAVFTIAARTFKPQPTEAAEGEIVPMELVLLADTSSSIKSAEYRLQNRGYAKAFSDPEVIRQIEAIGGLAVCFIEWDRANRQTIRIPWTHLKTRDDCLGFASTIDGMTRVQTGNTTMMAPALEFAAEELMTNEYLGLRRVIDVSGDGLCKNWNFYVNGNVTESGNTNPDHFGTPWPDVIQDIEGKVHAVNGIFIGDGANDLAFYENEVPQGDDSFSLHAESFDEFADTVKQKVLREVSTAIPGTYD
ncbi:MAG: DUF1194 domain-containing protein [Planctomycetota bacterium]|jgi:hypothetical protein